MSKKPVIITLPWLNLPERAAKAEGRKFEEYALHCAYAEAVEKYGGGRLIVLPYGDEDSVKFALEIGDGLLIPGDDYDIDPVHYGERAEPQTALGNSLRFPFEKKLILAAIAAKMPILGICGGMQSINVALGGSLYQDIEAQLGIGRKVHYQAERKMSAHHEVETVEGTILRDLLGKKLKVNSTHHQAIKGRGEGLLVSGKSPDGIIESIELEGHPFCIGAQWHPERLEEAHGQILISEFVERCKEYRKSPSF